MLALDPGQRTGWARSDGACGTLDFRNTLWPEASDAFTTWLSRTIRTHAIDTLAIERVIVRNADTGLAFGLAWDAYRVAHHHNVRVLEITPQQAKRAATGKPSASKAEVLLGIAAHNRWRPLTYHEADAAAVLLAAEAHYDHMEP